MAKKDSKFDENIDKMRKQMNRFYSNLFSRRGPEKSLFDFEEEFDTLNMRNPLCDIYEDEKVITINLEIPGIDKKDIEIEVEDNTLKIKAQKKEIYEEKEKSGEYHRIERSYAGFYRRFRLPMSIDENKIKAKYDKGVLEVTIPKTGKAKRKGKKVSVD